MPQQYKLGILFVHGIGEQPKADTLLASSEPLVQWLRQALRPNGTIRFTEARLNLAAGDHDEPAYATLAIEATPGEQQWLLAESWWGGEVRRPSFFKLAGWMLTTGAWMIVSHFLRGARSRTSRFAQFLFVALPLVVLSQLAILILSVLALIPLPNIRSMLSGVLLRLTGVVGDTYVFVENKAQQAAIITEVCRDLRWLSERCEKVAVLAHSQGAAVATRALHAAGVRNAELLLTYGSGIAKIEEIECISERSPDDFRAAYLTIPLSLIGVIAAARVALQYTFDLHAWLGMFWALMAVLYLFLMLQRAREYQGTVAERIRSLGFRATNPELTWHDIYSTADLVPGGHLGDIPGLCSHRIVNRRSWLVDHTTYWQNTSQFLPRVAIRLAALTGLHSVLRPEIRQNICRVAREHHRRVAWLVRARRATFAAALLAPVVFLDHIRAVGDSICRILSLPLVEGVGDWILAAGRLCGNAAMAVHLLSPQPTVETTVIGGAMASLAVLLWHPFYNRIWNSWDRRASAEIFGRTGSEPPLERWLTRSLYIALGFVPAALLALRWAAPSLFAADRLELRVYHLLGWIFVILAVVILVIGIFQQSLAVWRQMMWKELGMLIYLIGFAAVFLVLFVPGLASEDVQATLTRAAIFLLMGATMMNRHLQSVEKVRTPVRKVIATVFPIAAAVLLAIFAPNPDTPAQDRIAAAMGMYMFGVGVVMAIVARSRRHEKEKPDIHTKAAGA
jgi:Ca2+/Na+ antiporter